MEWEGRQSAGLCPYAQLSFSGEMRPEFAAGARNAVRTCLNIGPQDRVCIIRDRPRQHIAEAIEEEAQATGATVRTWTMEDHLSRPATSFPTSIPEQSLTFPPTPSYSIHTTQQE